ncbi:hypothetical protein MSIMFB_00857 [Mycobacterium simulans]|uniref:Uncharacterized protein n=1 Tax=Mycobacterium simulans TaxID=627089 RepID=A0A7Z7IGY7_9MYCO|nr:hypothetical protein [Mycobacterium simulans]SOJ53356.1 hypothetical protein MSIMFB_00857 [Mycobacterium simulans]SON58925.1 hypothetical protein MSIMFI_00406 [Mycobacterium simulans]
MDGDLTGDHQAGYPVGVDVVCLRDVADVVQTIRAHSVDKESDIQAVLRDVPPYISALTIFVVGVWSPAARIGCR